MFYIAATIIILSAVLVIASPNPVASAISLIVCLLAQAVLFLSMGAELVAALQVLLYAGAIMVLFLFVIMLLNLGRRDVSWRSVGGERILLGTGAVYLAITLIFFVVAAPAFGKLAGRLGSLEEVGKLLLTKYFVPFELTGVLLLVAIVGAVALARRSLADEGRRTKDERRRTSRPSS